MSRYADRQRGPKTCSAQVVLAVAFSEKIRSGMGNGRTASGLAWHEEVPMSKENPNDDPRQRTDWKNTKQTDEPWKGQVEKEQKNTDGDIDLEKWHDTNTH
jgi:hypothetical protein